MTLSEQSLRLINSRPDVLSIVEAAAAALEPMDAGRPASVSVFREIASSQVNNSLGNNRPPNDYTRYAFQRLAVKAALELDGERRIIAWAEPIDWSSNV